MESSIKMIRMVGGVMGELGHGLRFNSQSADILSAEHFSEGSGFRQIADEIRNTTPFRIARPITMTGRH
jgi:hypothetical protein